MAAGTAIYRGFHIGEILFITAGCLPMKDERLERVYGLIEYLIGPETFTNVGPSTILQFLKWELLRQFPQLKFIRPQEGLTSVEIGEAFVRENEERFGVIHFVSFRPDAFRKFCRELNMKSDLEVLRAELGIENK